MYWLTGAGSLRWTSATSPLDEFCMSSTAIGVPRFEVELGKWTFIDVSPPVPGASA